ncbi:MAG: 3-deoxy-8-phosphooctulonate synthase, partial [Bacteroidetes bacterium]|nr:3-deoxy-8-phosphooctulonate synthase [Bacteroidota bacterium]
MIDIPKLKYLDSGNFFLIAGPCAIEGKEIVFEIAEKLKAITDKFQLPFIFKASYRKANRTKLNSFTGIGDKPALEILKRVGDELDIPTLTD